MNADQIQSFIRTLLKLFSAWLVTKGYGSTGAFVNSPDVAATAILAVTLLWSHLSHAAPSGSGPSSTSSSRGPLLGLILMAGLFFSAPILNAQTTIVTTTNGTTVVSTNDATAPADFLGDLGIVGGALQSIVSTVDNLGLLDATNYALAPYFTYAPSAKDKVGGGILIPFDFPALSGTNGAIGMAVGMDWLGHWSLISGNVTMKLETHPLNIGILSFLPASVRGITAEPIAIVGVGAPLAGSSGAATLWDVGYNVKFGHFLGGSFGAGATWGEWMNAGAESGHRYHFFLDWRYGF